jgi:circadian clock protein KaiC
MNGNQPTLQPHGIEKMPTGIEGLDEITGGGLPRNQTSLVIGGPGSGKTVFALQTLVNGACQSGEPGIFVAFEENAHQIITNAASFGWDFPTLEKEMKIFFFEASLSADVVQSGQFDLAGLLAGLKAKAGEMGARRIVFDSVDVLLMLLNNSIIERREIYRIRDWLAQTNISGIITARIEGSDPLLSEHYSFMQFMADCVVLLHHRLADRVSLRDLRVMKYRGSNFAEAEFPMVIGPQGIEVINFGSEQTNIEVSTERVSTGIERLDLMLDGGYFRGSTVLITGTPGTAKSTLAAAFANATCQNNEKALYISFDEVAPVMVRNLSSVGIRLSPHIESGLLRIYSAHSATQSSQEHLLKIRALIKAQKPSCLVIDPISAMVSAGGSVSMKGFAEQLLHLTRMEGLTFVCISLISGNDPLIEMSAAQISTMADTWINLTFMEYQGERNRALTIIKSRGTGHSNQVRELILSDQGITLADVYTAGGEVLLGSMRWEKERAMELKSKLLLAEAELKRSNLEIAETETLARIETLKRELKTRRAELALLNAQQEAQMERLKVEHKDLGLLRGADKETA